MQFGLNHAEIFPWCLKRNLQINNWNALRDALIHFKKEFYLVFKHSQLMKCRSHNKTSASHSMRPYLRQILVGYFPISCSFENRLDTPQNCLKNNKKHCRQVGTYFLLSQSTIRVTVGSEISTARSKDVCPKRTQKQCHRPVTESKS